MNILGIDYGLVNIGFAIAYNGLISPYASFKKKNDEMLLKEVLKIISKEKIDKIVIGLPEGKIASLVKNFSQKLSKATNFTPILVSEDLSSKDSIKTMIELGKKKKSKKNLEHQISACLILENYLEGIRKLD